MWQVVRPLTPQRFFEKVGHICFRKSWWVWLCALLIYTGYDLASKRQVREISHLQQLIKDKENKLQQLEKEHLLLQKQIASKDDPAYIELLLRKNLGLTPKGSTKVYFVP